MTAEHCAGQMALQRLVILRLSPRNVFDLNHPQYRHETRTWTLSPSTEPGAPSLCETMWLHASRHSSRGLFSLRAQEKVRHDVRG